MAHFGGRCGWEGLGARGNFANEWTIKWASSKTISEESTDTLLQDFLKELAIIKIYYSLYNISKNSALTFLSYFKNKYFVEHLTMATSGNVQNM